MFGELAITLLFVEGNEDALEFGLEAGISARRVRAEYTTCARDNETNTGVVELNSLFHGVRSPKLAC